MRLTVAAKQTVSPKSFWLAVAIVIVVLGAGGIYWIRSGSMPHFPDLPWYWAAMVVLAWGALARSLLAFGARALSLQRVAFVMGVTMFTSDKVWLHGPPFVTWAANVGGLILFLAFFSEYVEFGKKTD